MTGSVFFLLLLTPLLLYCNGSRPVFVRPWFLVFITILVYSVLIITAYPYSWKYIRCRSCSFRGELTSLCSNFGWTPYNSVQKKGRVTQETNLGTSVIKRYHITRTGASHYLTGVSSQGFIMEPANSCTGLRDSSFCPLSKIDFDRLCATKRHIVNVSGSTSDWRDFSWGFLTHSHFKLSKRRNCMFCMKSSIIKVTRMPLHLQCRI